MQVNLDAERSPILFSSFFFLSMNTVYPKIERRVGTVNDETVDFESILTIYALWRSVVQSCEEVAKRLGRLPDICTYMYLREVEDNYK